MQQLRRDGANRYYDRLLPHPRVTTLSVQGSQLQEFGRAERKARWLIGLIA
jgi:hypothetical protein